MIGEFVCTQSSLNEGQIQIIKDAGQKSVLTIEDITVAGPDNRTIKLKPLFFKVN